MNKRKLKKYAKKKGLPIPLILSIKEKKNKMNKGGLSSGQATIAAKAPPRNRIDGNDFKVLREEKARGRGMGLQDEKVQPGKVMKAKKGHFSKSNVLGHKRVMGVFPTIDKVPPTAKGKDLLKKNTTPLKALGKVATSRAGALGAILGAGAVGLNIAGKKLKEFADKKKKPEQKPIQLGEKRKKMPGRMGGGMMMKYSKGGGLDMGGPKGRLMAYAKENMIKDKDRLTLRDKAMIKTVKNMDKSEYPAAERYLKKLTSTKKMGGGMIAPSQRPGYSKGIMVKARGCKLGRTRPTKIT